jgi:two-component system OmpR family sensor kinase
LRRLSPPAPRSILAHTLILLIGIVLLLTALNVGIILFRPPPADIPVSAYEVARLIRGEPLAKSTSGIAVRTSRSLAHMPKESAADDLARRSIAVHLGLAAANVRFHRSGSSSDEFAFAMERQIGREAKLYGPEQVNLMIFGSFEAGARLPDGRWRVVSRRSRDAFRGWQMGTALRLLVSLLIVLPIAWMFSARLARPIRAFASAAEKLGRQREVEFVDISGPTEIKLAAAALNDMQTRLSRSMAERTAVVGAIAHDLRTPLSRLHFHLAAAPDPVRTKAEAEIAEMEQMIASTLDFVQNETRVRAHEPLDLALLVEGVVDDLADLGREVRLEEAAPATIEADPILLKRLFANLINNAVSYGERAAVRLRVEDGRAVVDIADNGPGLDAQDLERAFEPFYRAESSRNRATGGMGLGLAIVRAAAQAHGGTVELLNRPEGGLCARVTLPLGV